MRRTTIIIIFSWIFGVVDALMLKFSFDSNGNQYTYWHTYAKVPLAVGPRFELSDMFYPATVNMFCSFISGIATIVFSALVIRNLLREQARVAAEWEEYGITTTELYYQKTRRILVSLIWMPAFFILSTVPATVLIVVNDSVRFLGINLSRYMALWFLLAPTAWNPWLYNFCSSQFNSDLALLLQKLLPKTLGQTPALRHSAETGQDC